MPLGRRAEPFDHPDWLFELKYDGFRSLAVIEYGRCNLYSRNGHEFNSFADLALRIGNVLPNWLRESAESKASSNWDFAPATG
jgi:hypothetical protein